MRRNFLGTSVFLIATIAAAILIWLSTQNAGAAPTPPLSQAAIESKAVVYAQHTGLQGTPTSIVSKQMTRAEFNTRLDPFSNDSTEATTQVWLVAMKDVL